MDTTPNYLEWELVDNNSSCFQSISTKNNNLFSVNLLNGIFLFDGNPIGRLSLKIVEN